MSNQILKTRINLKIDTLAEWNKSNLILGNGEIAIATASSSAAGLNEPVCMIKIGDGVHTFAGLGWDFYAKSSDVLTACKTEKGLTEFIDSVIAKAGIASDDAMKALAAKVETAEADIKTIKGDSDTTGSIANAIKTAINALDLANTYATKTEASNAAATAEANAKAHAETKASEAQSAAIAAAAADATSKADAAKAGAEATAASALAAARTAISAEIDADVTALETALDARLDVLEAIQHDTFATKAEMEAETEAREAAEAQVLADAQAYADDLKDAILGEGIKDTFDTLKEIQDWIEGDGVNATELTTAIAEEAGLRKAADDALAERIKAYEDVKATYATKSEVEAAQSAAATDATSKANAAEAAAKAHADSVAATAKNEAISTAAADATGKADAAKASAIETAAADATAKANAAKSGAEATASADATAKANAAEAAAKAYADGLAGNYATKAQGEAADSALQSVSSGSDGLIVAEKSNNTQTISFNGECVFVFDCGDSKTNIY